MARPITDTLRLLDEGAFLDRCSTMLGKLVCGVEETGKAGKLQITLTLKRSAKGALLITPDVTTKVPEPKLEPTMLWATPEGNLTQDTPSSRSWTCARSTLTPASCAAWAARPPRRLPNCAPPADPWPRPSPPNPPRPSWPPPP